MDSSHILPFSSPRRCGRNCRSRNLTRPMPFLLRGELPHCLLHLVTPPGMDSDGLRMRQPLLSGPALPSGSVPCWQAQRARTSALFQALPVCAAPFARGPLSFPLETHPSCASGSCSSDLLSVFSVSFDSSPFSPSQYTLSSLRICHGCSFCSHTCCWRETHHHSLSRPEEIPFSAETKKTPRQEELLSILCKSLPTGFGYLADVSASPYVSSWSGLSSVC